MSAEESKAETKGDAADAGVDGCRRTSTVTFQDLPSEPPSSDAAAPSAKKPGLRSSLTAMSFRVDPDQLVTAKYFQDHYSLLVPSSSVRFRGSTKEQFETHGCHVIENENHQIILEERLHVSEESADGTAPSSNKRTIQIKRVRASNKGLQLLRALYTIVCVLFAGLFLAFAIQLTLNIVLDMAIISGDTDQGSTQWWHAPPLFFALIQFCHTFAEGMVLVTRFVMDSWSGHYLVKEFFPAPPLMRKNLVFVDWLFFAFLLGIPLTTMIITLFAGMDNCWVVTGVVWFASVGIFFTAFAGYAVYYEVRGAIHFVMNHDYPDRTGSVAFSRDTFLQACKRCIIMRQTKRYSGKKRVRYFAKTLMEKDSDNGLEDVDEQDKVLGKDTVEIVEGSYSEKTSIWSKISMSSLFTTKLKFFRVLDVPKKLYNIDDAQGIRPFVTKWSWSLERMYCNPASSRSIAIVNGPGAVTKNQVLSSLACSVLGTVLVTLLIVSFLVWFGLTWWLVVFVLVLLLIWIFFNIRRVRKLLSIIYKLNEAKKDYQPEDKLTEWFVGSKDEDSNQGVEGPTDKPEGDEKDPPRDDEERGNQAERQSEKEISEKATEEVDRRNYLQRNASEYIEGPSIGFYIVAKNMRLTEASESVCWFMMFWEIALFYVWPVVVLYVLKTSGVATVYMIGVGISGFRHYFNIVAVIEETGTMNLRPGRSRRQRWLKQSRLTDIVDKISTDKSKKVWLCVLGFLSFIFVVLLFAGLAQGDATDQGDTVTLTYLPEWYYPPQRDSAQYPSCIFGKPPSPVLQNYSLADMAFLSSLSYRSTSIVDSQLEGWFGPSGANVTDEYEYVNDWKAETGAKAKFSLFRFPDDDGATGIVSVRGTAGALDLLVDNQLWQAAMLAQLVRLALPFGEVFTPVLPTLVKGINDLQGDAVQRVSYYKGVTHFVNELKTNPDYTGMALTGHSLGGGIAIISAAQTGVGAVAVSGPNAMLSRLSFEPQLRVEALNNNTFNVVPHRDWIPMFDDKAQNYQNIDCKSGSRNPLSCHSIIRSLCELQYTCGTNNRPALCECVTSYGFPMPETEGDQNFEEMCANANKFE